MFFLFSGNEQAVVESNRPVRRADNIAGVVLRVDSPTAKLLPDLADLPELNAKGHVDELAAFPINRPLIISS